MIARLIVYNKDGTKVVHPLKLHPKTSTASVLKLTTDDSAETLEEWLFFFLRDHGAYIETTDPKAVAAALNMPEGEAGIILVKE